MSIKPILYGFNLSPPVRAVLLTFKALAIDYEFKEVNILAGEQFSSEYLKRNPQHTIPTLEDDGHCIWDSHAICAYLVRKYGQDDTLYPKDFYRRAIVDQRLHFDNGTLFAKCVSVIIPPLLTGKCTKSQYMEKLKDVTEAYNMLEAFLHDQHSYMAGNSLTIADLSIASTLSSLMAIVVIDTANYPKLNAWFDRIKALPYYEEANGIGADILSNVLLSKITQL